MIDRERGLEFVRRLCADGKERIYAECLHTRRIPVESCLVEADVLAQLCLGCGAQLEAAFASRFDPPTHAEINAETAAWFADQA